MEHKDVQAYLKSHQHIQADMSGDELEMNHNPMTHHFPNHLYESYYEMNVKDQRKLPNYIFNFTLPADIGKRRQKFG